jgi:hypothetical protein
MRLSTLLVFVLVPQTLLAQRLDDRAWRVGTTVQLAGGRSRELDGLLGVVGVEGGRRLARLGPAKLAFEARVVAGVTSTTSFGDIVPMPDRSFTMVLGGDLRWTSSVALALEADLSRSLSVSVRGGPLAAGWREYIVCDYYDRTRCPSEDYLTVPWGLHGGSIYGGAVSWRMPEVVPIAVEARWERWRFRHGATAPVIGLGLSLRF